MKKIVLVFVSLFLMGGIFAQSSVTFTVDMSADSTFNPAVQNVYFAGSNVNWPMPGSDTTLMMIPDSSNTIYSITFSDVPNGEVQYKYFIVEDSPSWANGEWDSDPNRIVVIAGDATINNVWGNKPSVVTFNVNMSADTAFDPAHDEVYIAGDLANNWAIPGTIPYYAMTGTDSIYSITLNLYNGEHQYKYFVVTDGVSGWDGGEWPGNPNRIVTIDTSTVINDIWGLILGIPSVVMPEFSMYPNPVINNLYIDNIKNANRIEVYNLVGQKVKEINNIFSGKAIIQTSDLTKGVYIVSVIGQNGAVKSLKFMKK